MRELFGTVDEEQISKLATLLTTLYLKTNKPYMFIPHVINSMEKSDDDILFLSRVFEKLPKQVKQNSVFVKPKSFLDAKGYLKQCIIAVCARMHCAVNAITVNTPALFLVYSNKALGMAELVYGNRKWCVSLCNAEEELVKKVLEMLENLDILKAQISNCQQIAFEKYEEYIRRCKEEK